MNPTQVGPYLILDKLGAGGMGSVYLGRHSESGLVAAVKVLPASLAREEGFIERFNREIEAMLRLNNEHIVKVYESGTDGETYYFAMEYVAGETVMSMLRRERKVSWQRAVDIALQICQALKAAHDAGIIHRDLKPSNLLISQNGMVKLTDFGVAQMFATQRLTVTGGVVGTAEFMSPEQAGGKRATKQSDLYSLGALMYVLVTGRPPFGGTTAIEVMHKHKFAQFERPRLLVPDLPIWIEEIIVQLLEKDPQKRMPDAVVLQRRLEQALRKIEVSSAQPQPRDDETEITLSEGEMIDEDTSTVAVSSPAGRTPRTPISGPATLMQRLMRAELEDMMAGPWYQRLLNNGYVLTFLLVSTIAGGVWWFRPRHVNPAEQFATGVALLQQPASPEWLRAKREYFDPLLQADPERWADELAPYLRRIELYELTRPSPTLNRRHRERTHPADQKASETNSDVSQQTARFLRLARAHQQMGDPARAERIVVALRDLMQDDPARARDVELINQYLEILRTERQADTDRDQLILDSLVRADRLAANGQIGGARKVWASVIELYGDDPLASAHLARAHEGLAKFPALKESATP